MNDELDIFNNNNNERIYSLGLVSQCDVSPCTRYALCILVGEYTTHVLMYGHIHMAGFTIKIKLVGHAGCHINLFFYHTRMEVKFKADLRQRQADGAQTSLKIIFVSEPAVFPQRLLGSSLLP